MTPQAQYEANLALVEAGSPGLAAMLQSLVLTNIQMGQAPSGALTGAVFEPTQQAWAPLAHLDDPWAEAERDVANLYHPQVRVFVLLGLGLGYFPLAFAKRLAPYQRLVVCEGDPVVFKAAMHASDLRPILAEGLVHVILGDGCEGALEQVYLSLDTPQKLALLPPMRSQYTTVVRADFYARLQAKAEEMLRYHGVGLATWAQFGRHIGENDLGNLPEYLSVPGMNELDKLWEGRPAVCLAAGPSLRRNLTLLADPVVRRQVAVICAGPMYGVCRELGIVPDIVTAIDFQRLTFTDQFQHVPLDPRTSLVYLHSLHPSVVRHWPGPVYVARNSSDTTEWMQQFAEPKATAGQVQTVAHLNLVCAQMLGAHPILLLGQDLSQPADVHHAPGARSRDALVAEAPEAFVPTVDIEGAPVWTRHNYLSMQTVFRQMVAARPDLAVINCTEGGIGVPGVPNRPLTEVLAELRPGWTTHPTPLAELLEARAAAYSPQTQWATFEPAWQGLRAGVEALIDRAAQVQAMTALWLPEGDPPASECAAVLAAMPRAEAHPQAFASIVVRRFDLVALMSQVMPPALAEHPAAVEAYQARQAQQLAAIVREEGPRVLACVDAVGARLADVRASDQPITTWTEVCGLLRRGQARVLWQRLRHPVSHQLPPETWHLAAALCALATQQYAEAAWLAPDDSTGQALARYARRRLTAAESGRLRLLQPYLTPVPPAAPAVSVVAAGPITSGHCVTAYREPHQEPPCSGSGPVAGQGGG